jgi:hypothetical protein
MSQDLIGVVAGSRIQYKYWLQQYNLDPEKYVYLMTHQDLIGKHFEDIETWGMYWDSCLLRELEGGWDELSAYVKTPGWKPHGHNK